MAQGRLVLAGGAEFGGPMAAADRQALALAGGAQVAVRIIPTAAAPDGNDARAGANGVRWFRSLGAQNVAVTSVVDAASANDPALVAEIRAAGLIYLLGGFPHYLAQTLRDSLAWQALCEAYGAGAVVGGSSAGAMVLCAWYLDPQRRVVVAGLGLLPKSCVIPHHNSFGAGWAATLTAQLPETTLLGIDEGTALVEEDGSRWRVYGSGGVTLYLGGQARRYASGDSLSLSLAST